MVGRGGGGVRFVGSLTLKELKFSGFDGGHPVVVIRKLDGDWSKTLSMGLFVSKISWLVTTLFLSKPPHLLQITIV